MTGSVTASAPATIANVGSAFDVVGLALNFEAELIRAAHTDIPGVHIDSVISPLGEVPSDPKKNCASVAVAALLHHLGYKDGITLSIEKKLPLGTGLGSSAASSAAALVATAALLECKLDENDLISFAMLGEKIACGTAHADNVAPALRGGVVVIQNYAPLSVYRIPYPEDLWFSVVCPSIEIRTEDARKVLPKHIPLALTIKQMGNVGGLVAGFCTKNIPLIAASLEDVLIEPVRAPLIPGFNDIRKVVMKAGGLGLSISGSGPTLFALSTAEKDALRLNEIIAEQFARHGITVAISMASQINSSGAMVIS